MKTRRATSIVILSLLLLMLGAVAGVSAAPRPAPYHTVSSSLAGKTLFPPPVSDARGYDVLSYDLEITLTPQPSFISGQVTIGLQAVRDDLRLIHLDLVSILPCLEVTTRTNSLFFEHQGDSLMVHLPTPLNTAHPETILVTWEGRPRPHGSFHAGLMFRKHSSGTNNDPSDDFPVIANVSETWSAHSWWPCKDHPSDKALVSLKATVPDSMSLVANGTLLSVESLRPGWNTYHWQEAYPMPTYLVSLAASNYVGWTEECLVTPFSGPDQNITMGFHVFPQERPDAEIDLAVTCQAMEFMTDLAGPYPFAGEKYDQVEIKWGGAMEHPTATSLPPYFFTGTERYENLLVHEMAHQWFGDSLTPETWADIWLNEGFARYCEALWMEHRLGREAYSEFMWQIGPLFHDNLFVGDGLLADPDPILPNPLVYDKGAWLLHSLRLLLGDDDFFCLLRDYATDPDLVHGNTTTSDFIRLAELRAGRDLDRFFDPWLNTETVARLSSEVEIGAGGQPGDVLLRFQQIQDPWLEMAIPVVVHCPGSRQEFVFRMHSRQQEFRLSVNCPIDSVSVDPDNLVLWQRADSPAPVLAVKGPWPNPITDSGSDFRIFILEEAQITSRLFDARGRLLQQDDLGRVAATGAESETDSAPYLWHFSPNDDRHLAAGIYWIEFRAAGHRVVRKMAILH